MKLTQRKTFI